LEQKVHGTTKKGSLEYRSKTPGGAGYTRQTHEPHKHLHPPTHAPDHTRTPERTRRHKPPLTTHPIKRGGGDGHTDAWTHPDLVLLCVNRVNVNTTDATTVCERLPRCLFTGTCEYLPVPVRRNRRARPPRGLSPRCHPVRLKCQRHYLCRLEHGLTIWSHGQLRILPARCRARSATSHSGACIATTPGACGLLFQRSHGATAGLRQSKQANIRCTVSAFSYWRMTCLAAGSGSMHVSCPWQC